VSGWLKRARAAGVEALWNCPASVDT
jgi:hypothetical protein